MFLGVDRRFARQFHEFVALSQQVPSHANRNEILTRGPFRPSMSKRCPRRPLPLPLAFPAQRDVKPEDVEPDVLFDLGLVFGPIVALFGLVCINLFSFYDISRASHEETLRTLQERRREVSRR